MTATYYKGTELFKISVDQDGNSVYDHILRRWGDILLFSSMLNAVSLAFKITIFTDFVEECFFFYIEYSSQTLMSSVSRSYSGVVLFFYHPTSRTIAWFFFQQSEF